VLGEPRFAGSSVRKADPSIVEGYYPDA